MKQKSVLCFIIMFYLIFNSYGQDKIKTISSDENNEILNITVSENYIALKQAIPHPYLEKVVLFSLTGERLKEIFTPSVNSFIIKSEPIEKLNIFLVITSGWESDIGVKGSSDQIRAYDLQLGDLLWETQSNAAYYELSPNKEKLLTAAHASFGRTSKFQIISLLDGNVITPKAEINTFKAATWFDNERAIIVIPSYEKNKTLSMSQSLVRTEISQLGKSFRKLRQDHKEGKINSNEYQTKMDKLLKKKRSCKKK